MSAALKLEIYHNGEFLREVPCENEKEVWIGRDEDCVIRLEDRAISRKHGFFLFSDRGFEFEKKSKFGEVRINGKEASHASLKGGDRVEMGPYEIRVNQQKKENKIEPILMAKEEPLLVEAAPAIAVPSDFESFMSADKGEDRVLNEGVGSDFSQLQEDDEHSFLNSPPETPPIHEPPPPVDEASSSTSTENEASSALANSNTFDFAKGTSDGSTQVFSVSQTAMKSILQFGDGTANVSTYELVEEEIAIGRAQKCHIVLEDKRSSRKHSLICKQGGDWLLKDLGSANGTLVNGSRIDEHVLVSGDMIQIGDTTFYYQIVQANYEVKKDQFIQITHSSEAPQESIEPNNSFGDFIQLNELPNAPIDTASPKNPAAFSVPTVQNKSLIGKLLERYRSMNTKQQIIYGVLILAVIYFMLEDDTPQKKAYVTTGENSKTAQQKKTEKKPGESKSFEFLTPDQKRYVETEYQLAFDLYKNRDYDNSLLELSKIFSLVQDFKNAREIEVFAREGKRKLDAQEEDRKKAEQERLNKVKLQNLIDQVSSLMDKKRFAEAETLFSEIELLQPENQAVGIWRKHMIEEKEKLDRLAHEQKRDLEINKMAWSDFNKAKNLSEDKKYWDALDQYDELLERAVTDKKLPSQIKLEIKKVEGLIEAERQPFMVQGKQLESESKWAEAYRAYQKAFEVDPTFIPADEGMKRIRGNLTGMAKVTYAEGVFAESYSDWEAAEKSYREVLEIVPTDDSYYAKAESRLKKITIFRHPAGLTKAPEAAQ